MSKRRWLVVALTMALLLSLVLSGIALAEGESSRDVKVTVQTDDSGFVLAKEEVTVAANLSETHGFTDTFNGEQVTALDALVATHITLFGDDDLAGYLAVDSSGFVTKVFGENTSNFVFFVDGAMSGDGVYVEDSSTGGTSQTGYDITEAPLADDADVLFVLLQDSWGMDYYTWFEADGNKTNTFSVIAGAEFDLTLKGYMAMYYSLADAETQEGNTDLLEGAQLVTVDLDSTAGYTVGTFEDITGALTDEDGVATLSFATPGTYAVSAYDDSGYAPLIAPWVTVTVTEAPGANHAPALKEGVSATATADVALGSTYTLDLTTIFEDEDTDDTLTYEVKIGEADPITAAAIYSYTPAEAGTTILVFTAADGTVDSTDTYTVTLTATSSGVPPLVGVTYQISNAEQLAWFRDLVNGTLTDGTPQKVGANAILLNDIDMSTVCGPTAGPEGTELTWAPIAPSTAFTGDFDGNGHKLTNLYIKGKANYSAVFARSAGTVRNLTIASGSISSTYSYVAPFVGLNTGNIYYCTNLVNVSSTTAYAGGIACSNTGTIAYCVNEGDVSTTGNSSAIHVGGIATALNGVITNCYNTGAISAPAGQKVGGIAGTMNRGSTLTNCYNAGNVTAGGDTGGLIGYATVANFVASTVGNNYFLQTPAVNYGLAPITGGVPVTDAQMEAVDVPGLQGLAVTLGEAYAPDSEPQINGGYPVLDWQLTGALFAGVAQTPVFTTNLGGTWYWPVGSSNTLTVAMAPLTDAGTLSYQWYASTTSTTEGFSPIEGATEASYSPPTEAGSTTYYYVAVTNTNGDKIPATVNSRATTVMVVLPLTVKIDDQEFTGTRLQEIVVDEYPGGLDAAQSAKKFEIVSGTFLATDSTYLFNTLVNTNTNSGVSVFFGSPPDLDISSAYATGLSRQTNNKLLRLEIPGLKAFNAMGMRGTDGDKLPTLYMPDVETISYSNSIGSFYNSNVTTLYLPNLKTIGANAFSASQNTAIQTLILPGDMPTIASGAFTHPADRGWQRPTLWVPADKVDAYKTAMQFTSVYGPDEYCFVKAIPAGVTDLQSFALWAVARVPALGSITPAHADAVYLARDLCSALPYNVASGMASDVQKAYDAYARLRQVLLDDIETRIAGLPDVGQVTVADQELINGVWDDYTNFNPAFKLEIPSASVTRLNQVFSNLQEVMFDCYMDNGTPFVSIDTLTDGTKRVNHGQTLAEFQYPPDNSYISRATTYIGRGDFGSADFFRNFLPHSVVVTSDEVTIDGGGLKAATRYLYNPQRFELPTVTHMETRSILTSGYAPDWYLILPNIVSMDTDAYFDTSATRKNKAALYLPLMAKLEECKTILRADKPLMLPRLATGERVFFATPQPYVLLPALDYAGASFFATAAVLEAAWLPKVTKIAGDAFTDSGITDLYLGATPPGVLGTGGLAAAGSDRTVYVPDGAVDTYKAVDDGDTTDDTWFGWTIQPMSASTGLDDFLNYYITALPTSGDVTQDYLEWLAHMAEARESLTEAQQAGMNNAELDAALAAVASYESEAIANVESLIAVLGDAGEITLAQRSVVEAARAAYDALSKPARLQVENRSDLFAAEATIKALLLVDMHGRIAQIPDPITRDDIQFIRGIYRDYLGLTDEEMTQLDPTDVERLDAAIDEVVHIEADLIRADVVQRRIEALPAIDQVALKDEANIKSIRAAHDRLSARAKGYVGSEAVAKLVAAEARIAELKGEPASQKTVYVAIEKFTLGQGYVQTPVPVTITQDASPNVAAIILNVIGEGNHRHGGSVSSSFYLRAIKDDDRSEAVIPEYILDRIAAGNETVEGRSEQDWLSEKDYTGMAGWMYTVNNVAPSVGASDYTYTTLQSGDVIRWQFTVYGYGADLGFGSGRFWDVANKDALTAELAKVDASPEKSTWMQDATYAAAYAQAYGVIGSMTSTQQEVDACVAALRSTPSTDDLGTVTVSVSDYAPRRQAISTSVGSPIQFQSLTGLGNYQQPFGEIIAGIEVPITAGMNVRDAVIAALESEDYAVTTASGRITGVGPLSTPSRSATVAKLANGDAGTRSKWVLSQNDYAIADSESAGDFPVRDGDLLKLEYSVDGGNDVGCFPYTSTYFSVAFSLDTRLSGTGLLWDVYVPEGSDNVALTYTRQGPPAVPGQYNRYHKVYIKSNHVDYRSGQSVPITEGQIIGLTVSNPMSAGGSVYNSINNQVTGSGVDHTLALTVKYLKTPAHLEEAIEALPSVEELDYDQHNGLVTELQTQYGLFTQAEKDEVSSEAAAKLQGAAAKMTEIYNADNQKVEQIIALVNGYYGKITAVNYEEYEDDVNESLTKYGELNSRVAIAFRATAYYLQMLSSKDLIERFASGNTSNIGIPTDYWNDFMINAHAFNVDLGAAEDAYEVQFMDTPRVGNQGYQLRDYLSFTVQDPSIVEVREVPYTYIDTGIDGGNAPHPAAKYYLIPKKAGTTTFTATFAGFSGQTPEIVVHVNAPAESAVNELADRLTNINSIPRTTERDTRFYFAGQNGAPFTFKVNGSEAKVYVYNYLEYDGADAVKTEYPVDANGNVTVLLKDGYNPIEVTATYQGQRVTQVYGLRGKVLGYTLTNLTTSGATTFKAGDTVSLKLKGLTPGIYKILRIYNPSSTQFWFDTNMPRYDIMKSGGGQYSASEMQFVLTSSGNVVLRDGRVFQDWFGSASGGGNAAQNGQIFSHIPDIHINVAENPSYNPSLVVPYITGGNTVKAGDKVTISIPDLDTAYLLSEYTGDNALLKAFTIFATDIPGCVVKSKEVQNTAEINDIKTLEFTVPAGTSPGEYRIFGGRVDVTYGISWWMKYVDCFTTQIDDLIVQVTPSDSYLDLYLARSDAKAALETYADPDDYRPTQQTELAAAVATGKEAIDAANDAEAIAAALAVAKEAIDAIKTDVQLTAEEDQAAADPVIDAIAAIGTVTLEKESAVQAARSAYDALTTAQKALVTNYGVLTAAEARLSELKGTIKVTNVDLPATATVTAGQTIKLTATVTPADATDKSLTWSSGDTSVATVDENGNVTGVKAGTATITATAKDGSGKSGICMLTVNASTTTTTVPLPAKPTITKLSPTSGPSGGGNTITISGTGFTGATKVEFGGVAAQSFQVKSATQITAVVPAHALGKVQVRVTTPAGSSPDVAAGNYTYLSSFKDVSGKYAPAITELSNRGIIIGYSDGTFKPGNPVIRQQFAKMILGTLGVTPSFKDTCRFTDLQRIAGDLYPYHFVAKCVSLGIIKGKSATIFGSAEKMTRAQLITMVVRAAKLPAPPASYQPPFGKFDTTHYPQARIAAYHGLLDGLGVARGYNFYAPATRGETAQVLYEYLSETGK